MRRRFPMARTTPETVARGSGGPVRRVAVVYFVVQAATVVLWWILLFADPGARTLFRPPGAPDIVLLAFAASDAVFYVGASLAVAVGMSRRYRWWPLALCMHVGGAGTVLLYTMALAIEARCCWLGNALMGPAFLLSAGLGVAVWFRSASPPGGTPPPEACGASRRADA